MFIMFIYGGMGVYLETCGDQRLTFRSWLSPTICPKGRTQVVRFGSEHLPLVTHFVSPQFFFLKVFFPKFCVYVCVLCAHKCRCPWRLGESSYLELELEVVVSFPPVGAVLGANVGLLQEQCLLLTTETSL